MHFSSQIIFTLFSDGGPQTKVEAFCVFLYLTFPEIEKMDSLGILRKQKLEKTFNSQMVLMFLKKQSALQQFHYKTDLPSSNTFCMKPLSIEFGYYR